MFHKIISIKLHSKGGEICQVGGFGVFIIKINKLIIFFQPKVIIDNDSALMNISGVPRGREHQGGDDSSTILSAIHQLKNQRGNFKDFLI
ncbi:hypothetical protein BMI79_10590 [Serratia oryzae]|uniref:Uncharacterized protein n=1 Tax=Serratia oryzae TaxID=2034155 RepID=A0A1S8CJA6_9GAMM|nr:hypothetical protein BMI79_10590 [Serratia oryzae]